MRTTSCPFARLVPLVGMWLMLEGLVGGPALPAVSAASVEPSAYQDAWGSQNPWGQQDHWGHRNDRPSRRSGYGLPDRYTIHKGKG
jgi:hypothetical protein